MEYFVIVSKRTQLNLLLKALWKYFPLVCFMWSAQSSLSMVIIGLCSCKTKPWDLGYCLVSLIFFLQFWFIILCSASLTFTATLKSQLDKRNANYKMFSGSRTTKTCRSSKPMEKLKYRALFPTILHSNCFERKACKLCRYLSGLTFH